MKTSKQKMEKSPLLAFREAEQRQKIQFLLQNRLASPRRGRANKDISQLAERAGFEPAKEDFPLNCLAGNRLQPTRPPLHATPR